MGYSDEERRQLELQSLYENMEAITNDPVAAAILAATVLIKEDLPALVRTVLLGVEEILDS